MAWMMVFSPTWATCVEASTAEKAKRIVLESYPQYRFKPWLARDWRVRPATPDEAERYRRFLVASPRDEPFSLFEPSDSAT